VSSGETSFRGMAQYRWSRQAEPHNFESHLGPRLREDKGLCMSIQAQGTDIAPSTGEEKGRDVITASGRQVVHIGMRVGRRSDHPEWWD
jgi:hypothetical protein